MCIYYTLFGDIIFIVGFFTFLLDVVRDVKTTHLLVKIHTNSNKPMDVCLQRETHLCSDDWILFLFMLIVFLIFPSPRGWHYFIHLFYMA